MKIFADSPLGRAFRNAARTAAPVAVGVLFGTFTGGVPFALSLFMATAAFIAAGYGAGAMTYDYETGAKTPASKQPHP